MQITYSGEGQIKAPLKSGAFLLVPGIHEVTEEQFAELKRHPVFSRLIASGQINTEVEATPVVDQGAVVDGLKQDLQFALAGSAELETELTAANAEVALLQADNDVLKQRVAELEQELASQAAAPPPVATSAPDMTIPELKAKLTALGISFPSTANKAELQALLPK
jgi:hypothetical protein